jgi:hypothetical protein
MIRHNEAIKQFIADLVKSPIGFCVKSYVMFILCYGSGMFMNVLFFKSNYVNRGDKCLNAIN